MKECPAVICARLDSHSGDSTYSAGPRQGLLCQGGLLLTRQLTGQEGEDRMTREGICGVGVPTNSPNRGSRASSGVFSMALTSLVFPAGCWRTTHHSEGEALEMLVDKGGREDLGLCEDLGKVVVQKRQLHSMPRASLRLHWDFLWTPGHWEEGPSDSNDRGLGM